MKLIRHMNTDSSFTEQHFELLVDSVLCRIMEEAELRVCPAASHRGAMEVLWLHFWGALSWTISTYLNQVQTH